MLNLKVQPGREMQISNSMSNENDLESDIKDVDSL